jgi:hypothetical protein
MPSKTQPANRAHVPTVPDVSQPTKRPGRPPAGPKGTKRSELPQLSVRLPRDTIALSHALGFVLNKSQAEVVTDALAAYVGTLPASTRTDVEAALRMKLKT